MSEVSLRFILNVTFHYFPFRLWTYLDLQRFRQKAHSLILFSGFVFVLHAAFTTFTTHVLCFLLKILKRLHICFPDFQITLKILCDIVIKIFI